ncbi:UNVERIFIED_CONTAM: hypothetical protein FKN15_019201 [Acipenser sinensis]
MSYPNKRMDVGTRKTVDLSNPAVSSGESLEAVEMKKDRLEVLGYETATTGFLSVACKKDSSTPEDFLEVDQEHQARFSLGALSNPAKGRQGGEDSAVTVAIRVRPLNSREQKMKAKSVVSVSGQETLFTPHTASRSSRSPLISPSGHVMPRTAVMPARRQSKEAEEAGIIPRFCEEIFLKAAEVKEDNQFK